MVKNLSCVSCAAYFFFCKRKGQTSFFSLESIIVYLGIIISVIMITVFLLAFIIMAKFDEEEKSGETRVVCFVFSCSCFVCFCFRFFLVKRFQSIFLIFIIFLTAITIAVLKTVFFFFFSTLWFLFVCLFLCCDAEL